MLDRRADNVTAPFGASEIRESEDRKVVALCGTAREDDIVRVSPRTCSELLTGLANGLLSSLPEDMGSAARVAKILNHELHNQIGNAGIGPGRRSAIKVYGAFQAHFGTFTDKLRR
jgi:hypothetical protein